MLLGCGFVSFTGYMFDKVTEIIRKPYFYNRLIEREVISRGLRRHCVLTCYLALVTCGSAYGAVNQPDTQLYDISIPRLNAAEAINRLAGQTGAILLFPYDLAKSRQANPVVGRYKIDEALDLLLQGSGLSSDLSDKGVIRISLDEETEHNNKGKAMSTHEGKPSKTENRTSLFAAVSAALLSVFTPVTTTAQETAGTTDLVLEEIVVTATKSGETALQDTPLSIAAFTADSMARSGIESIEDLATQVPGLSISQNASMAQLYIRGVGTNLVFPGSDSSVTVHMDGVYLGRSGTLFADFVDLERVEVLRGPQGTIYGRNSAGGTINLVSKQPGDTAEAELTAGYGAYDRVHVKGSVSGPIVEDKLYASISGMYAEHDGYINNIATSGSDQLDEDTQGVRGILRYLPWHNVEIQLSADYMEQEGTGPTSKQTGLLFDGTVSPGFPVIGTAVVPTDFHTVNIPYGPLPSNSPKNQNNREFSGLSGRVTVDLNDNFTLSSLTATRGFEGYLRGDTDYSEVAELVSIIVEEQNQLSEEIQLTGRFDRFNFVAGFYYFFEDDSIFGDINLPGPGLVVFGNPDFRSDILTTVETDAWALFTQGTYNVTDQITFTAGIRYSEEEKTIQSKLFLLLGGFELPGTTYFNDKDKWTAWTPKFGIDYKWNDDILLYASVTRGFKSGGYNFSVSQSSFDPEFLWAYEAGIKSEWFDNRLRLNASGFYYDYTDLQVQQFVIGGGGASRVEITNAANAKVSGFELELNALPVPELELSAGIAYLDASYKDFITQRTGAPTVDIDVSGNDLSASPDWSFNLSGQYTFPLHGLGTASVRLEYQRMGDQFYTPFNDPVTAQSSYDLVNARLILTSLDEHWQMSVFGHNLGDEAYTNAIQDFAGTGVMQNITPPRTWGIDVSYRY